MDTKFCELPKDSFLTLAAQLGDFLEVDTRYEQTFFLLCMANQIYCRVAMHNCIIYNILYIATKHTVVSVYKDR